MSDNKKNNEDININSDENVDESEDLIHNIDGSIFDNINSSHWYKGMLSALSGSDSIVVDNIVTDIVKKYDVVLDMLRPVMGNSKNIEKIASMIDNVPKTGMKHTPDDNK